MQIWALICDLWVLDRNNRQDAGGRGEPVRWDLPGWHGPVGVAGGLSPGTEYLGWHPHLHHDDLQFYSGQLHLQVKSQSGGFVCLQLVLYGIRAPIIDPFLGWKPPLYHKEPAKAWNDLSRGAFRPKALKTMNHLNQWEQNIVGPRPMRVENKALVLSYPRERMIRLAALGFVWDVSYFISLPLGAWLYNSGSYVCVLGTSLLLYCIACLLGIMRLWNFKEKITKTQLSFKGYKTHLYITIIGFKISISRPYISQTCDGLPEGDLQEEAGKEAHLSAVHDVGDVALHDGGQRGDVLPVHVHQENVPVGDGPGRRQSGIKHKRKCFQGFVLLGCIFFFLDWRPL